MFTRIQRGCHVENDYEGLLCLSRILRGCHMRRIVSTSMLRRILGSTLIVMVLRGFCVQKAAEGLQHWKRSVSLPC